MKHSAIVILYLAALVGALLAPSITVGHSGGTNAASCHAGSRPYHCHDGESTNRHGKSGTSRQKADSEDAHNAAFCASAGGRAETRHSYRYPGGVSYIKVDCETSTTVYEGGLDKRSSLDSVQQALFFAALTGKRPAVVIYDTDGLIGMYEHRISVACEAVGVEFIRR